jgi:DNA polymerase-3 subunit delta'
MASQSTGIPSISDFVGNALVCAMLEKMAETDRIPQALLFCGPEGVGKSTLARRFGAILLGDRDRIEADDLSLPANQERIEERLSLASDKRADDPLVFASHPDFLTFPPDGPLRQISIQQMRLLKDQAQFSPHKGRRRVFLIDDLSRANEQAANSLLKILEEPPPYLLVIATVTNVYDLLPTIHSRSVTLYFNRVPDEEVEAFLLAKGMPKTEASERARLAMGCPGLAVTLDLEARRKQADAMLTLLEVSAGKKPFSEWVRMSEATVSKKNERLDHYLEVLLTLLQELLHLKANGPLLRYPEYRKALEALTSKVDLRWVRRASVRVEEVHRFIRRNAQKTAALDDLVMELLQAVS